MKCRSILFAICAMAAAAGCMPCMQAQILVTFERTDTDRKCPPRTADGSIDKANRPEDKNISGQVGPGASNDWLIMRAHWDDGKGTDFTLEEWCRSSPQVYSMRMIQSQNGKDVIRATPTGVEGTIRIGTC